MPCLMQILGLVEIIQELLAQKKGKERSLATWLHFYWDWPLRWQSLLPLFFNNFDPRAAAAANFPSGVQAYLAGLTFALVASPCSTPVLAILLGYIAASKALLNVY
ncbi:hypothetical protein ACSBR2_012064 [Camellia fascicularis]